MILKVVFIYIKILKLIGCCSNTMRVFGGEIRTGSFFDSFRFVVVTERGVTTVPRKYRVSPAANVVMDKQTTVLQPKRDKKLKKAISLQH